MNKLEKLFKPLIYHVVNGSNTKATIEKQCAVVVKDIAIKFSLWQQQGDCEWILNDEDEWYVPHNPHVRINTEQLFNIFIETL